MTNREYLNTLNSSDFVNWILFEAPSVGKMSSQSSAYLTEWLDSEYEGWITLAERNKVIFGFERTEDMKSLLFRSTRVGFIPGNEECRCCERDEIICKEEARCLKEVNNAKIII